MCGCFFTWRACGAKECWNIPSTATFLNPTISATHSHQPANRMSIGTCILCERDGVQTTDHHLIPVTRHKNKKTKKETTHQERHTTEDTCRSCHNQIHIIWTEKELEREWNSVEKLKSHPDMQKFIAWVKTKKFDMAPQKSPSILDN